MLKLKELRISRNVNQAEVASWLGITRPAYTNLENGKRDLDTQTLIALSEYFHVTTDQIFGIDTEEKHEKLSEDEQELLSLFRHATKDQQSSTLNLLRSIVSPEKRSAL